MKKILFLLFVGLTFFACVDEDDFDLGRLSQTTINPTLEANVMTMDFTAEDLLNQIADTANGIELVLGEDSSLFLRLIKDFSLNAADLDDDYFNKTLDLPLFDFNLADISIPNLGGSVPFTSDIVVVNNETMQVAFAPFENFGEGDYDIDIDSVLLSSGNLNFVFNSELPCQTQVVLKCEDIINTQTGEFFIDTITIASNENTNKMLNLSDYKLILNKSNNSDSSYINLTYSIILNTAGQLINGGDYAFDISIGGDDLVIELSYGNVGNPIIPITGVLNLDYFSDSTITSEMVDIKDFAMSFDVFNYTGIDAIFDFSKVHTMKKGANISYLFDETHQTNISIADALTPFGSNNFSKNYVTLHPNTSAIEHLPDQFIYDMRLLLNDGRDNSSFVYPNGKYMDIHTVIDIPIYAKVTDFVSQKETDALDFLQESDEVGDYIDSVLLKLNLDNTFPCDLKLELYAENYGILSSLLDKPVDVAAAQINQDGEVIASQLTKENVTIDSERYDLLRNANKIVFKLTLNTAKYNSEKVHVLIKQDSKLNIKMSVRAHTNITL